MVMGQRRPRQQRNAKPILKASTRKAVARELINPARPALISRKALLTLLLVAIGILFYFSKESSSSSSSLLPQLQSEEEKVRTHYVESTLRRNQSDFEIQPVHQVGAVQEVHDNNDITKCQFRKYPSRRYYGLSNPSQPSFLTDSEYIRGVKPILLPTTTAAKKICIESDEWEDIKQPSTLKFSDGQNPSILSVLNSNTQFFKILYNLVPSLQKEPQQIYVAVVTVGNSQCSWKDSDEEIQAFHLSLHKEPPSIRALFLVLDSNFDEVFQSTILLQRDAAWGKQKRKTYGNNLEIQGFDDARLFWFQNRLYLSYRHGKAFGYTSQIQNQLNFDSSQTKHVVYVKASQSIRIDGGRNFAMFENKKNHGNTGSGTGGGDLMALTWVDPITVFNVNSTSTQQQLRRKNKKKSDIHGTSGMLTPFYPKNTNKNQHNNNRTELLGIAHFHRPENRQTSDYARHGHHYTHAFFTITSQPPFQLKRLSNEFIFTSAHDSQDGDMIQFAAGLDIVQDLSKVIVSYGINDCEGAVIDMPLQLLHQLLVEVEDGMEVVDLMKKVKWDGVTQS